jgi:hypothetical protein
LYYRLNEYLGRERSKLRKHKDLMVLLFKKSAHDFNALLKAFDVPLMKSGGFAFKARGRDALQDLVWLISSRLRWK